MTITKWCPGHLMYHPASEFGRNSANADGLSTYCKQWNNKRLRQWKQENHSKVLADKRRARARKKTAGSTPRS